MRRLIKEIRLRIVKSIWKMRQGAGRNSRSLLRQLFGPGLAGVVDPLGRASRLCQSPACRVHGLDYFGNTNNQRRKPRGRKKSRIKAGGRFGTPGQTTPPRRAGRGLSVGGRFYPPSGCGRWSETKRTERKPHGSRELQGGPHRWFSGNLAGINAGVIFHPLGSTRGSVSFLCLQLSQLQRNPSGGIHKN